MAIHQSSRCRRIMAFPLASKHRLGAEHAEGTEPKRSGLEVGSSPGCELLHSAGEDFFHRSHCSPFRHIAAWRLELLAAVSPDRMGDAIKGNQTLVISLLIKIVNAWAWEQSAAVVLVGERVGHAGVGRAEGLAAIAGLAKEYVRLKAPPGAVIASVVERHIDIACYPIWRAVSMCGSG